MIRTCVLRGVTIAAGLCTALSAHAEGSPRDAVRAREATAAVAPGDAVVMTLGGGGPGKVASRVDFTVVHVDRGPHGFDLDLEGLVKLSMTCNERDLGLVATFAGAKTFRARITRGRVTKTLTSITRDILLPDFDTLHAGAREATTFRVVQGFERADAFSVVIEHDDQRIVLTPNAPSPSTTLPSSLVLSSTGLEGFTLAGTRFAWAPPSPLVATARR